MGISPVNIEPYTRVGDSGLVVYRAGLGTMQFGWSIGERESYDVLDTYVEAGGNLIDTADCYSSWSAALGGPPNPGGVSEEIIGRWMAARGNRSDLVIATKVRYALGELFEDSRATFRQREGLSRRWIMTACEDSLRRLGVDHIDLYQVHGIDPLVPIEETLSALTDLVRQGKVRYLGCSNYSAWRLMQALWASDVKGYESFISLQPEYNLLSPYRGDFEAELAQACTHYGIGVIPYSPLAAGMLTGKYRRDAAVPVSVRAKENSEQRFTDRNWEIIETLVTVAERAGLTPAQAAVNWLRAKPWVSAPILGANTPGQLREVLDGLDTPLPAEDVATLDRASDFPRTRAHRQE
jgi:aryl-alcohol dehydrogenase-like predicted oxidoreductase